MLDVDSKKISSEITISSRLSFFKEKLQLLLPGVALSVTVAFAAIFLSEHYTAPVMLYALLLGMVFNFLKGDAIFDPGINFMAKTVLKFGVGLLGVRITFDQIMGLGWGVFMTVCLGLFSTILFGVLMARIIGRNHFFGILTGGAVAICGASAALAISSVLPKGEKGICEEDTIFTVVAVTALSTIAMVAYPIIAKTLGFSDLWTGVFLGASIHDVAQVVGAGYSVSEPVGDTAAIVKLLRVAFLMPVIGIIIMMRFISERNETAVSIKMPVPLFLLGFAALAILNSMGTIPASLGGQLSSLSKFCLVAAIAALGTKTVFKEMLKVGPKALMLVILNTVWVAVIAVILLTQFL